MSIIWQKAANIAMNVAAVIGAICIVATILALVFGVRLVFFRSGSMEPAIPTGSLAVTRQIDATSAHPGDVLEIDRGDHLEAITHRMMSSQPSLNGSTTVTLKGDANDAPDPVPYTVVRVRLVVATVPVLGYLVATIANPLVMAIVTVVVAAIVGFAAWPRTPTSTAEHSSSIHDASMRR